MFIMNVELVYFLILIILVPHFNMTKATTVRRKN